MDVYVECKNCKTKHRFVRIYSMSMVLNDYNGGEFKCQECGKEYSVRVSLYENNKNDKDEV